MRNPKASRWHTFSILPLALLLLLTSCIRKKSITGPGDEERPPTGFQVLSTSPKNGATNVPQSTTFALTFSDSIDSGSVVLLIAPMPTGFANNLTVSPDRKTLSASVTLQSNTVYTAVLQRVRNTHGDLLPEPLVVSFTTGATFPTGSIEGRATSESGSSKNAIVGLINRNPLSVLVASNPKDELLKALTRIALVTSEDGSYKVPFVSAGTYWPVGVMDVNEDGVFDPLGADAFGFYDSNSDIMPDSIEVSEGQAVKAVDFSLKPNELRVLDTFPRDGATNVSVTGTPFSIYFSAPLDTDKVGFIIAPIPADLLTPELKPKLTISGDLRRFSATVDLASNTTYTGILFMAYDLTGRELRQPFVVSFTTGPSFPQGSVSGRVVVIGKPPQGTLVGLLNRNPLTFPPPSKRDLINSLVAVTIITSDNGSYTISHVAGGTYWVIAAKDLNRNGTLDLPPVDALGFYNVSITVREGQAVTGINFSISGGV